MKAIILAAGRGSRMKSLTNERPKCLVELHGKPLIELQLDAIRTAGITDIGVVTGYKRELLSIYNTHEFHNPRWAETQMVTSLETASEWLERESCIVSYSDIFYESSAVDCLIKSDGDIALSYDPNWLDLWASRFGDPLLDAETFRIDSHGNIVEIGGNPKEIDDIQGQYMGLLKFTPSGWHEFRNTMDNLDRDIKDQIHMTSALQILINTNRVKVKGVPYLKKWGEIDTQDDLLLYKTALK